MERYILSTVITSILILISSCEKFPKEATSAAANVVLALAEGNVAKAYENFDDTAGSRITTDDLVKIWEDLVNENGRFDEIESVKTGTNDGVTTVHMKCIFERGSTSIVVTIRDNNRIINIMVF